MWNTLYADKYQWKWFLTNSALHNVTQYNKRYILSTFEKIEIFVFSNWRFKKLSNNTKFIKIKGIVLKIQVLPSVNFLLFSLYFTHSFAHYLRINLADKMSLLLYLVTYKFDWNLRILWILNWTITKLWMVNTKTVHSVWPNGYSTCISNTISSTMGEVLFHCNARQSCLFHQWIQLRGLKFVLHYRVLSMSCTAYKHTHTPLYILYYSLCYTPMAKLFPDDCAVSSCCTWNPFTQILYYFTSKLFAIERVQLTVAISTRTGTHNWIIIPWRGQISNTAPTRHTHKKQTKTIQNLYYVYTQCPKEGSKFIHNMAWVTL